MHTISAAAAAVTGARHHRMARNGQDAAASWVGEGAGAVVVCDGCGGGASSEVGARLGAQLVIAAVAERLGRGERPHGLWRGVREQVVATLARLAEAMPGDRASVIRDHFLFTIVAAAVAGDEAGVWAIGDGAYAFWPEHDPRGLERPPGLERPAGREHRAGSGGSRGSDDSRGCGDSAGLDGLSCFDRSALASPSARCGLRVLGPFADNQPPYLAYDLLGAPAVAYVDAWQARRGQIVVATDGVVEPVEHGDLEGLGELGLDGPIDARMLAHPDGLRRRLVVRARGSERIDWEMRRVVRTPAALQDDGAVGALAWAP